MSDLSTGWLVLSYIGVFALGGSIGIAVASLMQAAKDEDCPKSRWLDDVLDDLND